MSRALAQETKPLVLTCHALLRELEAKRWRAEDFSALAPRFEALEAEAREVLETRGPGEGEVGLRLDELARAIQAPLADTGGPLEQLRNSWPQSQARLQEAYDALCASLREFSVAAPARRPENYARSVLHVFTASICIFLVEYVLDPTWMIAVAGAGVAWCWSMEIGRIFSSRLNELLLKGMSLVAHPHERREVNSATWYTTALLALALLFKPEVCVVALAVLGLADPAAALIGRRWGRLRLIHGRSLEGSLTFLAVGFAAALGALQLWHGEIALPRACAMAGGAALLGALAELLSRRIDDNLSIPLAAGIGAWGAGLLVHAPQIVL